MDIFDHFGVVHNTNISSPEYYCINVTDLNYGYNAKLEIKTHLFLKSWVRR